MNQQVRSALFPKVSSIAQIAEVRQLYEQTRRAAEEAARQVATFKQNQHTTGEHSLPEHLEAQNNDPNVTNAMLSYQVYRRDEW